ncbi:hypothetical protein ACFQZC_01160 [Streptacidiphilus monticola]
MTYPDTVATHSPHQVLYIDDDGLIRRRDYQVDIAGGSPGPITSPTSTRSTASSCRAPASSTSATTPTTRSTSSSSCPSN